jgi:hypothetical protein
LGVPITIVANALTGRSSLNAKFLFTTEITEDTETVELSSSGSLFSVISVLSVVKNL